MTALKRLVPNLFTAGNLVGGILAIVFALTGRIHLAPYCIFISALFDFLDGFMARLLKVPSEMGKQLDSLADMVTFGVAPGVIVFVMMHAFNVSFLGPDQGPIPSFIEGYIGDDAAIGFVYYQLEDGLIITYLPYLALLIPVFALFRLAKFNLDTRQTDSFIGLPTPAMTLFFAVLPLLILNTFQQVLVGELQYDSWQFYAARFILSAKFLIPSILILSVLMVAELPLFALKFKHFKWKENEIRYIFLTLSILMLATLFFWALPLIIILYLILSLINRRLDKSGKQIA